MPTETRHIRFQAREVFEALGEYQRRRDTPLPSGLLESLAFDDPGGLAATLVLRRERPAGELLSMAFDEETVGAALILLCIAHGIPMPAHAAKRLARWEDSVELVLDLGPYAVPPALARPAPARQAAR